jgi:hypothetical protein
MLSGRMLDAIRHIVKASTMLLGQLKAKLRTLLLSHRPISPSSSLDPLVLCFKRFHWSDT